MSKPAAGTPIDSSHPLAASVAGAWLCAEGSGTTLADSSTHGNTLTLGASPPTWGTVGGETALTFPGGGGLATCAVSAASSLYLSGSAVTLVARVYDPGTPAPDGNILGKVGGSYHYQLRLDAGAQTIETILQVAGGTTTAAFPGGAGSLDFLHGGWATLAVRYDGAKVSIWADGVKQGEQSLVGALTPSTDAFALGGRGDGDMAGLVGSLSAAWVFSSAPTDAQMAAFHTDPWAMWAASGDTTAPTLTSPTGSATGATTATLGVTTNEANGTLYAVATTSATPPSVAQVKAGQTNAGAAAPYAGNQAVSSTGAKTFSATGLSPSTNYHAYFVHRDAAGNDSTVAASASFATSAGGGTPGVTYLAASDVRAGVDRGDGVLGTLVPADQAILAIKARTDLIPDAPAAVGSAMTLANRAITSAKFDTIVAGLSGFLERLALLTQRSYPVAGGSVQAPKSGNGSVVVKGSGGATLATMTATDDGATQTLGAAS